MTDLYYWTTPNGHKITIFLEETGLPYTVKPVNIGKGEQFTREFLAIAPNNRIPAIVDHAPPDGGGPLSLFESGAILLYLAGKTGRFYPADMRGRCDVAQWFRRSEVLARHERFDGVAVLDKGASRGHLTARDAAEATLDQRNAASRRVRIRGVRARRRRSPHHDAVRDGAGRTLTVTPSPRAT